MAKIELNSMSVDCKVMIGRYSAGLVYSMFDPSHPFLNTALSQPLPVKGFRNNFISSYYNKSDYWLVEETLTIDQPSFDLKKAFNCFNLVPSVGASYTLKLCVDVPDNSNPMLLPPETGSETGHTFIVVTKSNGSKSITQVFGFYASRHPGYFSPFKAIPATIRNNQQREINASIEMGLTERQFEVLRNKAFEFAKNKYAALDYNCTNYGLDVFNSVRSMPMVIDAYKVNLPSASSLLGASPLYRMTLDKTPQMLFKKLKQMKECKCADSYLIKIDQTENTLAPLSHGECN